MKKTEKMAFAESRMKPRYKISFQSPTSVKDKGILLQADVDWLHFDEKNQQGEFYADSDLATLSKLFSEILEIPENQIEIKENRLTNLSNLYPL